jgi:hypothetical protein
MANSLKLRLGIGIFSLAVICLMSAMSSNFYAENTVKYWDAPLEINDFMGLKPPFTSFGAGISSGIYLNYDSNAARWVARAGQNNMYSWMRKGERLDSVRLLKHEQYHFNITEVHARILNEYIRSHPDKSEEIYQFQHRFVNEDLNEMQDRYDNETHHSLNTEKQYLWEYSIDSLLVIHSPDSGWVTDRYSGANVFFPSVPKFTASVNEEGIAVRSYAGQWRGVVFGLTAFQAVYQVDEIPGNLRKYYQDRKFQIETFGADSTVYSFDGYVVASDSTFRMHDRWIYDHDMMYKLTVVYSVNSPEPSANAKIAQSFVTGFSKKNMDKYWRGKFEKSETDIFETANAPVKSEQKGCFKTGKSIIRGFYYGPTYRDDGALLIAFDIFEHPDSVIKETIWVTEEKVYSNKPDNNEYIYYIPSADLPKRPYTIDIGYTIKNDSTRSCYRFFNQTIAVIP